MPNWMKQGLDFIGKLAINTRVSAFILVCTCITLCRATVILVRAAYNGRSLVAEIGIVVGALVTLAGYAYGRGKLSRERGQAEDSIKKSDPAVPGISSKGEAV